VSVTRLPVLLPASRDRHSRHRNRGGLHFHDRLSRAEVSGGYESLLAKVGRYVQLVHEVGGEGDYLADLLVGMVPMFLTHD